MHHLEELAKTLECLIKEYQCHLPTSNYLVLRHQAQQRARQIKLKYLALPLLQRKGRKREDWRFRNRVGQKADTLRKVIINIIMSKLHMYYWIWENVHSSLI